MWIDRFLRLDRFRGLGWRRRAWPKNARKSAGFWATTHLGALSAVVTRQIRSGTLH